MSSDGVGLEEVPSKLGYFYGFFIFFVYLRLSFFYYLMYKVI